MRHVFAERDMKRMTLTAAQAKEIDRKARERYGIATFILMENAGRAVAEAAAARSLARGKRGKIAVFCGRGNNGGDGFVAARHLLAMGLRPDVFLAGAREDVSGEALANLDILLRLGQEVVELDEGRLSRLRRRMARYGVIVDALLGVGLAGEVRGAVRDLIGIMNASKAYVVSVDVPSGFDATSGKALGACVRADMTVTFVAKKRGMASRTGRRVCGRVVVRDIGIPA